jgi:4-oxalocrotonate tautomerase
MGGASADGFPRKGAKGHGIQNKEWAMPHVVVKLIAGKSEEQKARLTAAIVRDVMEYLDFGEEAVSVAFEEIAREDWAEKVYRPEIQGKRTTLYKEPGYDPFAK